VLTGRRPTGLVEEAWYWVIGSVAVAVARMLGSGISPVVGSNRAALGLLLSDRPVELQPSGSRAIRHRRSQRLNRFM